MAGLPIALDSIADFSTARVLLINGKTESSVLASTLFTAAGANFAGPASSVDDNFVAFDGTTGKVGKDSGKSAASFATAAQGTKADNAMPKSGGTFTGPVVLSGDPTANLNPATKQYVDALPLTKSYESAQQTITSAGSLTLAHGLGAQPKLIALALVCVTAEGNYAVGNEVEISLSMDDTNNNRGASIVPDATNLNLRFGSNSSAFNLLNKTTGARFGITNADWKLIVRAWL